MLEKSSWEEKRSPENKRMGHFFRPKSSLLNLTWLLIFYFLFPLNSLASGFPSSQEKADEEKKTLSADRLGKSYLTQVSHDLASLITAPKRWEGPDIMNLAATFGAGTVLFTLDQDIFNWVAERRSSFSRDLSRMVTRAGDGGVILAFCAGLYGAGEVFGSPELRRTSLLSIESLTISSMLVASLKYLVGRARPHAWEGSQSFHPFSFSSRHTSFPSGHATAAFSVATTIAARSKEVAVDIVAYSLATLVALARVHDEAHWASDVLAGSALGYFVGRRVVNLHRPEKKHISLFLYPVDGGLAVSFTFSLDRL